MDEEEILESTIYNVTWKWDQLVFGDCNQVSQGTKTFLSQTLLNLPPSIGCASHTQVPCEIRLVGVGICQHNLFFLVLNFTNLAIYKVRENHQTMFHQLFLDNLPTNSKGRNPHLDRRLLLVGVMICWQNCTHSKDSQVQTLGISLLIRVFIYLFLIKNLIL
jgi:hypothetical protein